MRAEIPILDQILALDAAAARACSQLAGWAPLDIVMGVATVSGVYGAIWLVLGLALALRHGGAVAQGYVRLVWSVALATLLVSGIIKPLVGRTRPDVAHITRSTYASLFTSRTAGHSFPSGHAAQAVAGASALALMWPRRRRSIYALAALIASSRLYLGVHYPLDVLVGGALGWAVARVATARTPCYISKSARAPASVPR